MVLFRISSRRTRAELARAISRRLAPIVTALALPLFAACGDATAPDGGGNTTATLSGTVRSGGESVALANATITVGTHQASSDASGRFELAELPLGAANIKVERPGYATAQETITISAGANTRDFALTAQETYTSGAYAMYVPAGVFPLRGVIIALGGGVTTSGFATGGPLEPSNPVLEQSLQTLGVNLRALAKSAHVVLLGTTTHALANSGSSDDAIFAAISAAAAASGHTELVGTPVLLYSLDAGSNEAGGLVSRNPERSIGLLMRVPTSAPDLTTAAALAVPTFVMQSELDDNSLVRLNFSANRSRGGLWALAVEPGVMHAQATDQGNSVNVGWIAEALALRLPATAGAPLVALPEAGGWLGNQSTLEIAPWADYSGDRATASWLLSQPVAFAWKAQGSAGSPSGQSVR